MPGAIFWSSLRDNIVAPAADGVANLLPDEYFTGEHALLHGVTKQPRRRQ